MSSTLRNILGVKRRASQVFFLSNMFCRFINTVFYYLLVIISGSVSTSQSASNSHIQSASISPKVSASVSGESIIE